MFASRTVWPTNVTSRAVWRGLIDEMARSKAIRRVAGSLAAASIVRFQWSASGVHREASGYRALALRRCEQRLETALEFRYAS